MGVGRRPGPGGLCPTCRFPGYPHPSEGAREHAFLIKSHGDSVQAFSSCNSLLAGQRWAGPPRPSPPLVFPPSPHLPSWTSPSRPSEDPSHILSVPQTGARGREPCLVQPAFGGCPLVAVLGTHQHRIRLASLCLASLSSIRAPPPHYCLPRRPPPGMGPPFLSQGQLVPSQGRAGS